MGVQYNPRRANHARPGPAMEALERRLMLYGNGVVKVYLLAGQSNMVGHGLIADGDGSAGMVSLEELIAADPATYDRYDDPRGDVWSWFENREPMDLQPGHGDGNKYFGPELGLGHTLGDALDNQVLLIR